MIKDICNLSFIAILLWLFIIPIKLILLLTSLFPSGLNIFVYFLSNIELRDSIKAEEALFKLWKTIIILFPSFPIKVLNILVSQNYILICPSFLIIWFLPNKSSTLVDCVIIKLMIL